MFTEQENGEDEEEEEEEEEEGEEEEKSSPAVSILIYHELFIIHKSALGIWIGLTTSWLAYIRHISAIVLFV